jgi:enoyl-CoA hydratase
MAEMPYILVTEAEMSYETLELLIEEPLATIRLNRPERMNAVIEEMYLEVQDVLVRTGSDHGIRCLILTGSVLERDGVEKQAFCAGADLKKHASGERSANEREEYIRLAHATIGKLVDFSKPVLAAVNGPARGAGTEMALACDLLLMAEEATLGLPETGLGTFVGGGVTHTLPRLVGLAKAKELVFTGRVIDGRTAFELGLAVRCCPLADLMEQTRALALEISEKAPMSIAFAKSYLHRSPGQDFGTTLEQETKAILACMESSDWHEGHRAFREKRKPKFIGR